MKKPEKVITCITKLRATLRRVLNGTGLSVDDWVTVITADQNARLIKESRPSKVASLGVVVSAKAQYMTLLRKTDLKKFLRNPGKFYTKRK